MIFQRRFFRPHHQRHPLRRPRPDFGEPFAVIFERYGQDFYNIDLLLFSPAEVCFHNLDTGSSFAFGRIDGEILRKSFGG